jgi:hypothetical protein
VPGVANHPGVDWSCRTRKRDDAEKRIRIDSLDDRDDVYISQRLTRRLWTGSASIPHQIVWLDVAGLPLASSCRYPDLVPLDVPIQVEFVDEIAVSDLDVGELPTTDHLSHCPGMCAQI